MTASAEGTAPAQRPARAAASRLRIPGLRIWVAGGFLLIVSLAWLLGTWFGYHQLERQSLEESFRYNQLLGNELDRYRPILELMAEHPLMAEAFENPDDDATLLRANEEMKRMATIIDGSDVYLMDRTGLTIAANNYDLPSSFVGGNFGFRPYFIEPMTTGASGLYFALGTTSLERGLYFSHPVKNPADPTERIGVIVVKILVEGIEQQWQRPSPYYEAEMVVQDGDGIVFLSSQSDWLYRAFEPITAERLDAIYASRRYANQAIRRMPVSHLGRPWGLSDQSERILLDHNGQERRFLSVTTPLPRLDWDLRVMVSTRPVLGTQLLFLTGGIVIFLGLLLASLYLRERYRREAELAERGEQLEKRVAERTSDLEASNRRLLGVIRERERAQEDLKEAQQELIQAG